MRNYVLVCVALLTTYAVRAEPNPAQVLADVGITNAAKPTLVAKDQSGTQAVVTARQGTNFVAIVAYRDPASATNRWVLARHEFRFTDHSFWVRGKREYERPPSREDVVQLLGELFPATKTNGFAFHKDLK